MGGVCHSGQACECQGTCPYKFCYPAAANPTHTGSNNRIKTDTKISLQLQSEAGLVFGEKKVGQSGQLEDTSPSLTSLVLSLSFLL